MEEIVYSLNLDLRKNTHQVLVMKEDDVNSRVIEAVITDNGKPYDLTNCVVNLKWRKPDNHIVYITAEKSDYATVRVVCSDQMLAVAGTAEAEFDITGTTAVASAGASTLKFMVSINETVIANSDIESSDEFGALQDIMGHISNESIHVPEDGISVENISGLDDIYAKKDNPKMYGSMQHRRKSGSTVGITSFTWGYGLNTASGTNSFALGYSNTSTGDGGFAMGRINTAGNDTIDGVTVPVAIGEYNKVTASDAAGIGYGNTVKGNSSMALGASNTIEENSYCVALGSSNTCSKTNSIAIGDRNQALGKWSLSKGYYAIANQGQETCGHFNSSMDSSVTAGADTTTAFIIGNGSSDTERSNALRILYDGTVYSNGSYNATGADYAEYFEWEDGNPNNEDRRGYFVTFAEGDLIRKATDNDDYILGIVSGNPCIIGNADEHWCGQYLLDEFGAYIMEEKEVEYEDIEFAEDEEGNIIENAVKKKRTSISYKENPDYDASQQYIPRSERQEWDAIGMMGVLSVRDDGTCKVNGYCKCNNNGIATYCEKDIDTYRVIKRVSENVIKIVVFK